jgi:hypothetical protein
MTDREYKAAGAKDVDSIRRTKKQESVQLRKQKREERLLEKRATLTHLTPETKIKYPPPSIEDLPQLAQQVSWKANKYFFLLILLVIGLFRGS